MAFIILLLMYVNCMAVTASLLFQSHEGVIFSLLKAVDLIQNWAVIQTAKGERQAVLYLLLYGKNPHSQKQRPCRSRTADKLVFLLLC